MIIMKLINSEVLSKHEKEGKKPFPKTGLPISIVPHSTMIDYYYKEC